SPTFWIIGALIVWFSAHMFTTRYADDVINFYTHAEMVRHGEVLYWPWPEFGPHFMLDEFVYPRNRLPYPPFLTPALSLFTGVGEKQFLRTWYVILFIAFWGYAAALGRLALGRLTLKATIIAGLLLTVYPGTWSAVLRGNVDVVLWAS